ncbi:hypothetical protein CRYUN_Cryun39dG0069800 [Craigia yunnanensis]
MTVIFYVTRWTLYEILRYAPQHNWSAYKEALKTNPVLAKMVVSGVVYSIGDWIAWILGNSIEKLLKADPLAQWRDGARVAANKGKGLSSSSKFVRPEVPLSRHGRGAFIPPDPSTTKYPLNEELANLTEASNIGVALSGDVPGMPKKVSSNIRQRKASPASNPSQKSKESSTGDEVNGNGKATKQLRKQVTSPQIVDDLEDGTLDQSLLHTPEDEIDVAKVVLKDIILFADYKERLAVQERGENIKNTFDQSKLTFREENDHDEETSVASEQDQGFTDDQVSDRAQSSSFCLNYQSYMNKEPRARCSKQGTELFYGAIRQFGPDFSLIQLFLGRSRHQIKLKFKHEERRSPFKLSEALASRANDHSYFEKVIEQLQQVSGAEQESQGDVSVDLTCEDVELTPRTNEKAAKPEQDEDVAVRDQEADVTDDHSTLKSDETDDDYEILSSYRSAF